MIQEKGGRFVDLFVKDFTFYKKILAIGGPVALQQVITVGVNMMDTVMLGQLNETALSASAAATQIHSLFQFMSMGMGMGASVLIARYWGAGEIPSLRKTLLLRQLYNRKSSLWKPRNLGIFSRRYTNI